MPGPTTMPVTVLTAVTAGNMPPCRVTNRSNRAVRTDEGGGRAGQPSSRRWVRQAGRRTEPKQSAAVRQASLHPPPELPLPPVCRDPPSARQHHHPAKAQWPPLPPRPPMRTATLQCRTTLYVPKRPRLAPRFPNPLRGPGLSTRRRLQPWPLGQLPPKHHAGVRPGRANIRLPFLKLLSRPKRSPDATSRYGYVCLCTPTPLPC